VEGDEPILSSCGGLSVVLVFLETSGNTDVEETVPESNLNLDDFLD
jgi:hypothetical protein